MSTILVCNAGSSSLKYTLYYGDSVITKGVFERLNTDSTFLNVENKKIPLGRISHEDSISFILNPDNGLLKGYTPDAIGHRIAHGGALFKEATLLCEENISILESLNILAPLHNPPALSCIKFIMKTFPDIKNVGVFDTSFYKDFDERHFLYPIPKKYYENYNIRKYGFHGTSHKYLLQEVNKEFKKEFGKEPENIITCHLGNGSSISAIKNGTCINTSMGLTPLGGVIMGTRCGDMDPSVVSYILDQGISLKELEDDLSNHSGLLALSGISSDIRDISKEYNTNSDAAIAIDMLSMSIARFIASSAAVDLGKIDVLVFSGGIGTNSSLIREQIFNYLNIFGFKLDLDLNSIACQSSGNMKISADGYIPVFVIPTDEELLICQETQKLI